MTATRSSGGGAGWPKFWTTVASADASSDQRASADFVCDGTSDESEINSAINQVATAALPSGGYTIHGGFVQLIGQQFRIGSPILLATGVTLAGTAKSYTTLVPSNGSSFTAVITLAAANTERTVVQDLNINGNASAATCDAFNYSNTSGSFTISPDSIHRIHDVDLRNVAGSGLILSGSNLRGAIIHGIRMQQCSQHGVSIRNGSSDHRFSQVSVIACGTDDATMTYNGWHLAANITGYDGSGHPTFGSTYTAGGSASIFVECRADFQRGRGWLIDASRVTMRGCMGMDNWGAGLDLGPNSNGAICDFLTNSGMFPQAGIEGSDSGVYVQGGFHQGMFNIVDRGFASGNIDAFGNYGQTTNYGLRFRDNFANGCNFDIVSQKCRTDSITGGRVLAGDNHNIRLSSPTNENEVQYVNLPSATGGTFKLTFDDTGSNPQTTGNITFSTTAATLATNIQTALRALSNIGGSGINVIASGNQAYQAQCTFAGTLGNKAQPEMTVDGTNLTGTGAAAAAEILTRINGGTRQSEFRAGHGPVYLSTPKVNPTDSVISASGLTMFDDPSDDHLKIRYKDSTSTLYTLDLQAVAQPTPLIIHQPGYNYVTFDSAFGTGAVFTTAVMQLARLDVDGLGAINDLDLIITSVAGLGSLSNAFVAIYADDGTQLWVSTDQSASWTSTGLKTVSPGITPASGFVWVGVLLTSSGTMPSFLRVLNSTQVAILGFANTLGTARAATQNGGGGGLSSPPSPLVPSSGSLSATMLWAGAR